MTSRTQTMIQIPLDIPQVEVLSTEIRPGGKLLIRVESQVETTGCGICGQDVRCTFGHGQEIQLRHLSVLGLETYICIWLSRWIQKVEGVGAVCFRAFVKTLTNHWSPIVNYFEDRVVREG